MSATAVSDWPTPTVSTSTTSKPAASTTTIASRVARATPPSVPDVGDGRMNASRFVGEAGHPGLVAEDAAARHGRRRVDGEHRHPVTLTDQHRAERVDERRLADAREPR